ncbi:Macrolide glycosyltransferase [Pseudonocardia sp. Ae168_Ps1]|nr:Macrolide glycosyltransferase [Pseudonocardia sp. Ae168_Ps1]OLL83361.1 Macrolide glycosyltransferase [Pseudonocardia sp. Ae263_Ps1]OLL90601.1 Macrolide glycosyltransferase [Pseudonocardia sp. Ae356_Ps1]
MIMSRHFTFVSMPASGHVNPTLPLVAELVRRGHRVSYATGATHLDAVAAAGAEPVEVPFVLPEAPPPGKSFSDEEMVPRVDAFAVSVEQVFPVLADRVTTDRPDVLCGDAMSPVDGLVAQQARIPHAVMHPSFASNEHFSLARDVLGAGDDGPPPAFRRVTERIAGFARERGLEPLPFGTPGDLNLVFLPREFQVAGDTFDDSFVFLGPALGPRSADVWDGPGPVLLVSLGTTFNDRPEFFRTCAEAFAGSGWQVVMAVGSRIDPADLGPLPPNVVAQAHVPQIGVLRRARAFVTHNGMNSTMEALLLGVPQIGIPQMPEQAANAARVAELGCGRSLDPDTLDAATLRATADEVATDPDVRAAAEAFGARMRAVDGPALGADALEAFAARA